MPTGQRIAREAAVLCLFAIAAVAMTWPLALHLDRAISDPGDPFFTTFTIAWDWHALTHGLRLFDAPLFFPDRHALAFSEHMAGLMLVLSPFFALGVAPLTIHNIGVLLAFAANGWCMYRLALWVTRSAPAAVIGGLAFAFAGFRFQHLPHLHFLWSGWLPIALLCLLRFVAAPTRRNAFWLAAAMVLNGLSSLHWLAFGTLAIALTLVFLLLSDGTIGTAAFYRRLAIAGAGTTLLLLPFTLPYVRVSREYGMQRLYEETIQNSAEWHDWLVPIPQSRAYAGRSSVAEQECALFPGFVILSLAATATALALRQAASALDPRRRRMIAATSGSGVLLYVWGSFALPGSTLFTLDLRSLGACLVLFAAGLYAASRLQTPASRATWCAILWLALGALGAAGVNGFAGTALYEHLAAIRGIRMPVRWVFIADTGLCLLAAVGSAALLRRFGAAMRALLTIAICALLLFELRVAPIRWYLVPLDDRPVYRWLAATPLSGGVLELPLSQSAAYEYLWHATQHHRPLINGVSSYLPAGYRRLVALYDEPGVGAEFLPELIRRRCSVIVVHEGALRERSDAIRAWLSRELATGSLTFIARFDAGTRPDWLFAVNAVEPAASTNWPRSRAADPAGRTPEQNLALFLTRGDWTYNAQPFLSVDTPVAGTIRGPLTVSGWALAPAGVSQVLLHLKNGGISVRARLEDRPDVQALLPWYPRTRQAGFRATFASPPRGVSGATDLQLEVVDGAGKRRTNPPIWFHWRRELRDKPAWKEGPLKALLGRIDAPAWSFPRLQSGTSAIQDFCAGLITHRIFETNYQFADRVTATLFATEASPALRSRYLELLGRGVPRDRVVEQMLISEEFRAAYLDGGRITIDQRITAEP